MGTRDQPRRMNALGYHVWAIRFWACMFSGLLTAIAGILFVYYTQFISPQALDLTASAEVLLMVISGGAGTLLGPDRRRRIGGRRQERGQRLHRALEHAARRDLRRHRHPDAGGPGARHRAAVAAGLAHDARAPRKPAPRRRASHERAHRQRPVQGLRRPARHHRRRSRRRAGRAAADHRPQRRRQDHAVQPDHRRAVARLRLDRAVRPRHHPGAEPPPRPSRHGAHLPDHHAVPARHHHPQRRRWRCSACRRCAGTR